MADRTVWGIHGGREWEADDLFRKKNTVAIGWHEIGDLSKYKDRDEYKQRYAEVFPGSSDGAIRNAAGMFFRFVHEMQKGEVVVYPSRPTNLVFIGEVVGDYEYDPGIDPQFPNQRKVRWRRKVPRTSFSQEALYEIGSALTLFQVKNYADEFLAALEKEEEPSPPEEEETSAITEEIESQTRDFVLKQLRKHFKGEALEDFVVHLLERMGYHARRTAKNKPSVDVIAHPDELGFEQPVVKCQVKSGADSIKLEAVEKLYSNVDPKEHGLFVALSEYSDKAWKFAEQKSNLRLIDGYELVNIILAHYDELDTPFKNAIPLKKVFLPNPPERGQ